MRQTLNRPGAAMKRLAKILFAAAALFLIALLILPRVIPQPRRWTKHEVEQLVLPGTSQETILRVFGKPTLVDADTFGGTTAISLWAVHPPSNEAHFSGFQVHYVSNRVLRWDTIVSTRHGPRH